MTGIGGGAVRLLDPRSTAAVVLGAHDWTGVGLERAPSFLRSAKHVVQHLYDPAGLGLDPELVLDLFDNMASANDQLAEVQETIDQHVCERRDEGRPLTDVLLYYIGHGHPDDIGQLSLLVRRSKKNLEVETGIKTADLARTLRVAAPQQRRLVVFDCCFSERAARAFIGMSGDLSHQVASTTANQLSDGLPARGTLVLCSSGVGLPSIGRPDADRTLFTGAVLEVLQQGAVGYPSHLSFADLRDAAHDRMVTTFGATAPRPVLHQANGSYGDLTRAPVFINRAEVRKAVEEEHRQELARKAAEEERQQELARKAVEEEHRQELARKAAEEEHRQEEARKAAEEERQQELARKAVEEEHRQELARKATEEEHRQEEARKAAEEEHRQELARKAAEEEHRQELARKATEEEHRQEEARKAAEEERQPDETVDAADKVSRTANESHQTQEALVEQSDQNVGEIPKNSKFAGTQYERRSSRDTPLNSVADEHANPASKGAKQRSFGLSGMISSLAEALREHRTRNFVAAFLLFTGLAGGGYGIWLNLTRASIPVTAASNHAFAPNIKPAIIYDLGGKFDKSFNESAFNGAEEFKAKTDIAYRDFEIQNDAQREQTLRKFAKEGNNPIVMAGVSWAATLDRVATDFPDTQFAIIDMVVDKPNVRSVVYKEQEGSYLVGVLGAMASTSKKVGFVGGMDIPLIRRFGCGYVGGAKAAGATDVIENMAGDTPAAWNDPTKGSEIAMSQIDQGADVVFAVAGGTGLGVLQAADDAGKLGIGVDSNQNGLHPGHVLTSMVKRVDVAVYNAFTDAKNGEFTAGINNLGVKEGGVDYAMDENNAKLITDKMKAAAEKAKADIIAGTITVHDYLVDDTCPY